MPHLNFGIALRRLARERSASVAAEYALLLAFIVAVIVAGVTLLGTTVAGLFASVSPTL